LFSKSSERIDACCFSTLPGNSLACLAIGRSVHVYDYLNSKLLFKLAVSSVRRLALLDKE
jgi:hypothetical protein